MSDLEKERYKGQGNWQKYDELKRAALSGIGKQTILMQ
jgi:hypothetical protein